MRLPGYCTGCHKIKQVTVSGGFRPGSTPSGICAACDEKARRKREMADIRITDQRTAAEATACGVCRAPIHAGWRFAVGRSSRRRWENDEAPLCREDADLIRY